MIVFNRFALRVAFVSFAVIVAIVTTITLQGLCNTEHRQTISHVHKRLLVDKDSTFYCDIMVVVKSYSINHSSQTGHGTPTKIFDCMTDVEHGSNALEPTNDYVCMFYAMLTNPSCKGYLFIAEKSKLQNLGNVIQNDRKKIWYGKRASTNQRREKRFCNKFLFNSNHNDICKKAYEELALLNIGFNSYEKRLNGSWQRPWNVEIVLNALLWNGKGKLFCFCQEMETFYVPLKYRETFLGLSSVFSKVKMPNAVAVPTILKSLDLESNFVNISN